MNSTIFIVLRRMRAPLILLIAIYAVSVLGLTLIPGSDAQGRPVGMSFFHAFYFMSYTATTIGFGEIPLAFNDAQRMWVTFCIYLSVVGWAYAIATLLGLIQDAGFRRAIDLQRAARSVRRMREPFYLVCGYGETGQLLARSLDRMRRRFAVIDLVPARIEELELQDYRADAPALAADAALPENLRLAGLGSRWCRGVFALTNDDRANLAVALATRLLSPGVPVLCRVTTRHMAENMATFGTEYVVDPFETFGEYLALAIRSPGSYQLMEWLTGVPGETLRAQREPPKGRWIMCGYGRFGHAVADDLAAEGIDLVVIDPDGTRDCALARIVGRGTEAGVLREAGVAQAVGIVAGTDDDIANISIVALARNINPDLFVVLRQNLKANQSLFDAFAADFVAVPAEIIAHEAIAVLTTPLLDRFLDAVKRRDDAWADEVVRRIATRCGERVPLTWSVRIDAERAPALCALLDAGRAVRLEQLLRSPIDRSHALPCVALMRERGDERLLMPADDAPVMKGDQILFAGRSEARHGIERVLRNVNDRDYVFDGRPAQGGWLAGRLRRLGAG